MTIPDSEYSNQNERWLDQLITMTQYSIPSVSEASGTIATGNAFGTGVAMYGNGKALLVFSGTWTATVQLQVSLSTAAVPATWYNSSTYSSNGFNLIDLGVACTIRVGIETGNYTSGTLNWAIKTGGRP